MAQSWREAHVCKDCLYAAYITKRAKGGKPIPGVSEPTYVACMQDGSLRMPDDTACPVFVLHEGPDKGTFRVKFNN